MKITLEITKYRKAVLIEEEVDFKEVWEFLTDHFPESWKEFRVAIKTTYSRPIRSITGSTTANPLTITYNNCDSSLIPDTLK